MQIKPARSVILATLIILLLPNLFFSPAQGTPLPITQSLNDTTETYLPLIINSLKPSIFGVEAWTLSTTKAIPMAAQGNFYWMRNFAFDWDLIEATPGVYDWSSVNETGLAAAAANGLSVVATVKYTPSWARKFSLYKCGPIKQDAFDEFESFLQELVQRYSGYPYYLKYIQFGNEPDVDPNVAPADQIYGCWGDDQDYYYGGGYYAKMLQVAYPAIKAVDPTVQVVIGGLLLSKDPNSPGLLEPDRRPGRFFEGILRNNGANNGANFFDIVAFHGYPAWGPNYGISSDEGSSSWGHLGGIVIGKVNFLRNVMTEIGNLTGQNIDKPIMQTEGSLRCYDKSECDNFPENMQVFLQDQANYGVILFTRNLAHNVLGTMWYTIESPGWNYSSLLYSDGTAKPVYNSIKFLNDQLAGSQFFSQITISPYDSRQLQVYEFRRPDKRIWVLWVADMCWEDTASPGYPYQTCEIDPEVEPPTFTIPNGWTQVLDRDGNTIIPVYGQLTLNDNRPYYIEFAPLP
jgi:hypothetical protein